MSHMAIEERIELFPLFVDYGQLGAGREWHTCKLMHRQYGMPEVTRMDISGFGAVIPSGITNASLRINEDAFLPGRNLLLLLCAAAYAYRMRANAVAIGLLNPENSLFPDQTPAFLSKAEEMIETAMGQRITVLTPLIEFTKSDVIALANARGIRDTYSCHAGTIKPCGQCVSCMEIAKAQERS